MAAYIILSPPFSARFIGSTQQIYTEWINHLLCTNHFTGTGGGKESKKKNMFQKKDNTISNKHYIHNTGKKYTWWIFNISEEYKHSFWNFETFIFLSMFSTIYHIFQWVMFNNKPGIILHTEVTITYCLFIL